MSVSQSADRPTDTLPPEPELEAIRQAIPEDLIEDLGEVPSRRLLQRIHAKLRGAPVEWLTQRIRLRRRIITSLGVIEHFAGDIGNTYQEIQRRRQRSSAAPLPPAPSSPEDIAALIAEARDILSDPQAGSGLHQWARDTLAAHANKTKTAGGGSS
ncbi:MAG TPA: hypothetical protein VFQ79_24630 [Bryobacteraceae bacterium]|nr:hypothetical protein [Bryobacteraceae bacterium]